MLPMTDQEIYEWVDQIRDLIIDDAHENALETVAYEFKVSIQDISDIYERLDDEASE